MRTPANESFPREVIAALRERGHDIAWVRTDAPASSDWFVLQQQETEDRVLVNSDKDFGE
jgi:predicted nuclease of predicted toxin-antitoxin system